MTVAKSRAEKTKAQRRHVAHELNDNLICQGRKRVFLSRNRPGILVLPIPFLCNSEMTGYFTGELCTCLIQPLLFLLHYLLSSVLGGCLKAAKESRGLKVRFNQEGVMSNQFILKSRGRQLLCEALICPMAEEAAGIRTSAMGGMGANMQSIPAEESIGF
eukprot:s675_g12.t1